ncbi:MAG TPA: pur operon repressor [Synergistaceae bacterium]|nr:pur operon repressor [Synergistaceae bacterium]HPJ24639.1 pur operon repressor [Synergistaceae bacterium]HPQ36166.1 pur operon repressor [Synergistaceae bacterium]
MKAKRMERILRIASKLLLYPSKQFSITKMADFFEVSKTVISEDISLLAQAVKQEEYGVIEVGRGRSGGAFFQPYLENEKQEQWLNEISALLKEPDRILPGGILYYSDIIFNPFYCFRLGYILATLFASKSVDAVMTSEVKGIPLGMFTAHALGVPVMLCRFRNRPSDGSAIAVHYPSMGGDVRTMYMGVRQLGERKKVLIIDDFMRGGSTVSGMLQVARESNLEVAGVGVFLASAKPSIKPISFPSFHALLEVDVEKGNETRVSVVADKPYDSFSSEKK